MLGPSQRIGRMQRLGLRFLEIFQNDGGFENRLAADLQHRRLARGKPKTNRLVGEINIDPFERDALLGQRYHCTLHIGTELVADQFQGCCHGRSSQFHASAYN
jgi:hypothetical protein